MTTEGAALTTCCTPERYPARIVTELRTQGICDLCGWHSGWLTSDPGVGYSTDRATEALTQHENYPVHREAVAYASERGRPS